MTPPDPPEDATSAGSDQSYEHLFADLFRRFWRAEPSATEAHPAAGASTSPDVAHED